MKKNCPSLVIVFVLSLLILFVDILTKQLVKNYFLLNESFPIIPDFFNLTYVNNYGGAWSILSHYTVLLVLIGLVTVACLLVYISQKPPTTKLNTFAYSLLLGGATGNLLDRILYGYVIDFLDFNIFGYNFPIFNFADICIVISIFFIIIFSDPSKKTIANPDSKSQ